MGFSPKQAGGGGEGANMPPGFSNNDSPGTKCRVYLKPGCKFELVHCLKLYEKKLTNLDHLRTLAGPVLPRGP